MVGVRVLLKLPSIFLKCAMRILEVVEHDLFCVMEKKMQNHIVWNTAKVHDLGIQF